MVSRQEHVATMETDISVKTLSSQLVDRLSSEHALPPKTLWSQHEASYFDIL